MIIVGWGRASKKIADLGIRKCDNCKNYAWFEMHEVSKKIKAYFIPVAKFGVEYYAVCPVCNNGMRVSKEQKDDFLRASIAIPPKDAVMDMWKRLADIMDENGHCEDIILETTSEALKKQYGVDAYAYVTKLFIEYSSESDLPK